MVDALYGLDVDALERWKNLWPDHVFGYEDFLIWARRHRTSCTPIETRTLPKEPYKQQVLFHRTWQRLPVQISLRQYQSGESFMEVIIGPTQHPCSILVCDMVTSEIYHQEHWPGRYQALHVDPAPFRYYLGKDFCRSLGPTNPKACASPYPLRE